jgi:hypothetical protein
VSRCKSTKVSEEYAAFIFKVEESNHERNYHEQQSKQRARISIQLKLRSLRCVQFISVVRRNSILSFQSNVYHRYTASPPPPPQDWDTSSALFKCYPEKQPRSLKPAKWLAKYTWHVTGTWNPIANVLTPWSTSGFLHMATYLKIPAVQHRRVL